MDNISTNSNVTEDQELAKVLESMNQQASTAPITAQDIDQAETAATPPADTPDSAVPAGTDVPLPDLSATDPGFITPSATPTPSTAGGELDSIKQSALEELRPLIGKLNLPAEEKFDTLLLIIRSTDDKTLLTSAYDTAKEIQDETKRAQALLDVIKEIDYFSNPASGQPQ